MIIKACGMFLCSVSEYVSNEVPLYAHIILVLNEILKNAPLILFQIILTTTVDAHVYSTLRLALA